MHEGAAAGISPGGKMVPQIQQWTEEQKLTCSGAARGHGQKAGTKEKTNFTQLVSTVSLRKGGEMTCTLGSQLTFFLKKEKQK